MQDWLDALFSGYRWYRKWQGGHWEHWYLNTPGPLDTWMRANYCETGGRPGLGHGRPTCEAW